MEINHDHHNHNISDLRDLRSRQEGTVKETYIKTVHYDDGNVAVIDATEEVMRMRRDLRRPAKETEETMSVEEVAAMLKVDKRTIQNWKSLGKLVEGKHYKGSHLVIAFTIKNRC